MESVQFSCSVVSDSLQPHESQHARPPCPSPAPGVHPDSGPSMDVMPLSHLILCRPILLPPSILPSTRVFSNEIVLCIRWPKYWSFSFNISPSNEYSSGQKLGSSWESHNSKRHMHLNVHWSTIYNSQDMEATQMSINRWMDKEVVVHIYNGILPRNKKEWIWVSSSDVD